MQYHTSLAVACLYPALGLHNAQMNLHVVISGITKSLVSGSQVSMSFSRNGRAASAYFNRKSFCCRGFSEASKNLPLKNDSASSLRHISHAQCESATVGMQAPEVGLSALQTSSWRALTSSTGSSSSSAGTCSLDYSMESLVIILEIWKKLSK